MEADCLWTDLKAGGGDLWPAGKILKRHLETLPYDPELKALVDAFLPEKRGWGRNEFINELYRLIGERYEVDVPHIEAKNRRTCSGYLPTWQ